MGTVGEGQHTRDLIPFSTLFALSNHHNTRRLRFLVPTWENPTVMALVPPNGPVPERPVIFVGSMMVTFFFLPESLMQGGKFVRGKGRLPASQGIRNSATTTRNVKGHSDPLSFCTLHQGHLHHKHCSRSLYARIQSESWSQLFHCSLFTAARALIVRFILSSRLLSPAHCPSLVSFDDLARVRRNILRTIPLHNTLACTLCTAQHGHNSCLMQT